MSTAINKKIRSNLNTNQL